jgi:hypothetical protein
MLSPEELVSIRSVARASLQGTCTITHKTRVRQPNGSWREVVVVIATNVPCRKVPSGQTPFEQVLMQTSLAGRGVTTFIVDGGVPVYRDYVLTYGGRDYGVAGVADRTDGEYTRVVVYDESVAPTTVPTS